MTKIDAIIDILYKTYFLLEHHVGPFDGSRPYLEDEQLTRQQAKDYLGISESTYKRKVKDGSLKPLKLPGGDRFYKSQLYQEYKESIRRGRI
ncbi:DNA-binding protein [Pedobacter frigidisoli]|uniref:DNA-binding protein n=1 Tax=Pedobacter frigidisoli TaxID=2530455 RepID=A0A4R0NYZ0_9SPHI|nr:DNA-binding protein [Pedobacter frigidisoli]TCD07680.1 DNA-binding protein [Pedobacter frigidisoli]